MRFSKFIPVLFTAVLFGGLLYLFHGKIFFNEIFQRMAGADLRDIALAMVFFLISTAGSVARYKFVIDRWTQSSVSFISLFLLSNFSYACGYFAPMGIASDVLRMGLTKQHLGISFAGSARLIVLDRLLALAGVALFALLFVPFKLAAGISRELVILEVVGLSAFLLLSPLLLHSGARMLARISTLARLAKAVEQDRQLVSELMSSPRSVLIFFWYLALSILGFGVGTTLVAEAIGFRGGLATMFFMTPTIMLAQSAPMFYAGFGAREAVLLIAFESVPQSDPNLLLGLSLSVGITVFLTTLGGAVWFLPHVWRTALRSKRPDVTAR